MCARRVCSWIFMTTTREILTVYKEGACRSIEVCIFNQSCTFPSSSSEKLMKPFFFSFSNKYSCLLFSNRKVYIRQTALNGMFSTNCQHHKFSILVYFKRNCPDSSLATFWTTYICFEGVLWNILAAHSGVVVLWGRIQQTGKRWLLFTRAKNRTVQ